MSEDQALALTATLAMLVLVGSSLVVRRLPARTFVRLALLWAAIFFGALLIVQMAPRIVSYFT